MQRVLSSVPLEGLLINDAFQVAVVLRKSGLQPWRSALSRKAFSHRVFCSSIPESRSPGAGVQLLERPVEGHGSIRVIIGPMFAGKTKELLCSIDYFKEGGIQTMVVKSDKDDRYDKLRLSTHDGETRDCFAVARLSELREQFASAYQASKVIVIDEAQFFPDLQEFCCKAADEDDKSVIVAGLNGDFRRQRFGQIMDLIPHADDVTHIAAECAYCRAAGDPQPAHFTLRIAADDRQEVVGGADKYAPVCRKHHNMFSGIRKASANSEQQPSTVAS